MIRPMKTLLSGYDGKDITKLSVGQKDRYTALTNYVNMENWIISKYNNDYANLNKVKSIERMSMEKVLNERQKSLDLYLVYNGLADNKKAVRIFSETNNKLANETREEFNQRYSESFSSLENYYTGQIEKNLSKYQKFNAMMPYFDKLEDSRISIKSGDGIYLIGDKKYKIGNKVDNATLREKDFISSIKEQGFKAIDDGDIPDGFYVELTSGILKTRHIYIYLSGSWYKTKVAE